MKQILLTLTLLSTLWAGEMVSVSGGTFTMGSTNGAADEKPATKVTVSSFKIDKNEVSNGDYEKCVKSGKCRPAHYKDGKCTIQSSRGLKKSKVTSSAFIAADKPVVCVTWAQARTYCRAQGKRLPTEAEWEYVATRAGSQEYSNSSMVVAKKSPAAVTSGTPGAYGVYHLNGNVWEWVNDRYERDYYKYMEKKNPKGPSVSRFRSIRGGGWYSDRKRSRSRNRQWYAPEVGEVSIGFRCAK